MTVFLSQLYGCSVSMCLTTSLVCDSIRPATRALSEPNVYRLILDSRLFTFRSDAAYTHFISDLQLVDAHALI